MLRVYKHYSFDLRQLRPAAASLSFSSYPGELFSDDDFFLLSSGLVILQTTNKVSGGGGTDKAGCVGGCMAVRSHWSSTGPSQMLSRYQLRHETPQSRCSMMHFSRCRAGSAC